MKRIIFILLLLIPIKINALGIVSSRISNDQNAMTGDTITISFYSQYLYQECVFLQQHLV